MLLEHLQPPSHHPVENKKRNADNITNIEEVRYHSAPSEQIELKYSNYQPQDWQTKLAHKEYLKESKKQTRSPSYEELDALQLRKGHILRADRPESTWVYRAGGGGAPVTDAFGNIITTRRRLITGQNADLNFRDDIMRKKEQNYRDDLLRQMEERKMREERIKEKERWEAEQEAKRIEQQRQNMAKDYEDELFRKRQKEEQMRLRMNQLNEMQERARREEQRRQQEEAAKREEMRKLQEAHKNEEPPVDSKSKSPPVPTVRAEALLQNKPPISPVSPSSAMSQLSELRKHAVADHIKKMEALKKQQQSYKVTSRRVLQDDSDDDENL